MTKLWWIVLEICKGLKVWFSDLPFIVDNRVNDFKKRKEDAKIKKSRTRRS
jgi:hypothetical protein